MLDAGVAFAGFGEGLHRVEDGVVTAGNDGGAEGGDAVVGTGFDDTFDVVQGEGGGGEIDAESAVDLEVEVGGGDEVGVEVGAVCL